MMTTLIRLTVCAVLHASVTLTTAAEVFQSGGFARAPEGALDIANVPAPLFRDPVFDGAADPSLVWHGPEMAWYVFIFYHCHSGKKVGTEINAKDMNKPEIKRSVLQMAELELRDGKMTCDRDR